jgi:hypothetical protein
VVDVAVREDDRDDRLLAEPFRASARAAALVSAEPSGSTRIQPVLPVDDAHVREVVAAHLMNARRHLEEAVHVVQLRLAPETRIDARGRVAVDEARSAWCPRHAAVGGGDHDVAVAGDEPRRTSVKSCGSASGSAFATSAFAASRARASGSVRPSASAAGSVGADVDVRAGSLLPQPTTAMTTARVRRRAGPATPAGYVAHLFEEER